MSWTQFFLLLVAIYLAPNLTPKFRVIFSGVCLLFALIDIYWRTHA